MGIAGSDYPEIAALRIAAAHNAGTTNPDRLAEALKGLHATWVLFALRAVLGVVHRIHKVSSFDMQVTCMLSNLWDMHTKAICISPLTVSV